MGIVASTGTTALAFAMLMLTGFKGLVELGLISASGVLLTAGATLTVLPALLVLEARWRRPGSSRRSVAPAWTDPLTRWHRHSAVILAVSGVLGGLAVVGVGGVRFDLNLVNLQGRNSDGLAWAERVAEHTSRSVLFAEVVVGSLEEAARTRAALRARPSVAAVDSVLSVLPQDRVKRALIRGSVHSWRAARCGAGARAVDPGAPVGTRADPLQDGRRRRRPRSAEDAFRRDRREARALIDTIVTRLGSPAARDALSVQAELLRELTEMVQTLKRRRTRSPSRSPTSPSCGPATWAHRTAASLRLSDRERLGVRAAGPVRGRRPGGQSRRPRHISRRRGRTSAPSRTATAGRGLRRGRRSRAWRSSFRAVGPALLALTPLAGRALDGSLMGGESACRSTQPTSVPAAGRGGGDRQRHVPGPPGRERHAGRATAPLAQRGEAITLASLSQHHRLRQPDASSHYGIWSLGPWWPSAWPASGCLGAHAAQSPAPPRPGAGRREAHQSSAVPPARAEGVQP
jgi:hypothetical protein